MRVSEMIVEEWKALLKDKRLLAILLLVPALYMLLFGSLYSPGRVRYIPTVYIDEDRSQLSQQIIQGFSASESFQVVGQVSSEDALVREIKEGKASAGIIIPDQLSNQVKQGKQGDVMLIIDGSNMIIANTVLNAANEIIQTFSGGISIKRLEANGLSPDNVTSLRFAYRTLYNPGLNYNIFLVLGLLGAVVQQCLFLGISLGITREKEEGTWGNFLTLWKTPWTVFYAKSLPYFFIGILDLLITSVILKEMFHIPFIGEIWPLFILSVAFILSLLGIGFLAALFSPNKLQATQVTMLVAVPSFLLSGFTWPFIAMPDWVSKIGHVLPLTYFLHGIREIAIKGNGMEQILVDIKALSLISCVTIVLSLVLFALIGKKQTHIRTHHPQPPGQQMTLPL